MTKQLVISAYQRDYSWIKYINKDIEVTVYRKGQKIKGVNENFIEENVGQDVHTFFYHIYNNYDSLADFTFFSQDFPFDHVSNFIEIVNANPEYWTLAANMNKDNQYFAFSNGSALNWEHPMPKNAYTGRTLICEEDGSPHHRPPELNIATLWPELFSSDIPDRFEFVPAGHFCASKEIIKSRSRDFYKKLVDLLATRPFCPYEVERLEAYIFDKNVQ